ncbi:MAG: PH domain-containing protein [Nitrososphaerota archaeon]|nr:PH domain-containing protein [Candidatus Bathyarchaeota archaeon]MDW8193566.1 PH domain-containing protein [Nitrososphaerota archaeon]
MSEEVEVLKVPEHVDQYRDIDLKLLPGEVVDEIIQMSPFSKVRSYVLCGLIALFGYSVYMLFSASSITVTALIPPVAIFLVTYFVWHMDITRDLKSLVFSIIKYMIGLMMISYVLAFAANFFSPILGLAEWLGLGVSETMVSLNPADNISLILAYLAGLANAFIMPIAPHLRLMSLVLIISCLAASLLIYFSSRGQLYYLTNKRIVVRRKFGTVQVTTLPLDGLVEVTAFQGFFGRLFGYGDVTLTIVSGGGAVESLKPKPAEPVGSFYEVKRKLEGVKDVWQLKDKIIMLRDRYVEAAYLERIEGELKRIRKVVEGKEAPVLMNEKTVEKQENT